VAISFVAIVHGQLKGVRRDWSLRHAPWYAYFGGVIGPVYVVAAIFLSEQLGFATFQLCAILGQVVTSLLLDWRGFLVLEKRPPTWLRIAASVALAGGTALTIEGVGEGLAGQPWWVVTLCALAALPAGAILPVQAAINAVMQQHLHTPYRAVVVSFAGGASLLALITGIVLGASGPLPYVATGEPWMWLGGLCGAFLVTSNVVGVPLIGAAAYSALFVSAQLTTAFLFDSFGAMNFAVVQISARRVAGVVLASLAAVAYQVAPKRPPAVDSRSRTAADVQVNVIGSAPGAVSTLTAEHHAEHNSSALHTHTPDRQ